MVSIRRSAWDDIVEDARTSLPEIAVGLLAGTAEEALGYFPCLNVAADPEADFEIDPEEMLGFQRDSLARHDVILGICYSEPRGAAYPSSERIRNWLPSYLCFVVSLGDPEAPELKAFHIYAERVVEEPIRIVDPSDSGERDEAQDAAPPEEGDQWNGDEEENEDDAEDEDVEDAELPQPELSPEAPLLHEVRRQFCKNRYLGWNYWLQALDEARSRSDWKTCVELTTELERGYELNSEERRRRDEICDWALFQRGGLDAIWTYYNRRLQTGAEDPDAHFRLALVFERQGSHDAAREHLSGCLAAGPEGPNRILAESAMLALTEEQQSGAEHPFFTALWQTVAAGPQEPTRELARIVREALESKDWRRGREAVSALETLGDTDSLGRAFASPSGPVRVAVAGALRRMNPGLATTILGDAASAESPLVRWQAIRHFAQNGPNAARTLLRALQQDPDVSVRIAAVKGLARIGSPDAIPSLRRAPAWTDCMGESLQQAAFAAIQGIESRYHPPPPRPRSRQPVRSAGDAAQFRTFYWICTLGLLGLGLLPVFLLLRWACGGYLFYALCVRYVLEPFLSPANFFSDKLCYTGRRPPNSISRLRSALNISVLSFPLWFAPPLALCILWLNGWSWWRFALTLGGGLVALVALLIRGMVSSMLCCKFCNARSECPRWRFRLGPLFESAIRAGGG